MKYLVIIFTTLILGVILGVYSAIKLFAFDVDVLGAPYPQEAFKLNRELVLKQNDMEVAISKGAVIRYRHSPKGLHYYSIDIIAEYGDMYHEDVVENHEYFYVQRDN